MLWLILLLPIGLAILIVFALASAASWADDEMGYDDKKAEGESPSARR